MRGLPYPPTRNTHSSSVDLHQYSAHKSKDRQHHGQKKTKRQTKIYKTKHRKLKIEQHDPHKRTGVNSGALKWLAVSDPLVTTVVTSTSEFSSTLTIKKNINYLDWKYIATNQNKFSQFSIFIVTSKRNFV